MKPAVEQDWAIRNLADFMAGYVEAMYFTDTGDTEQPPADAELGHTTKLRTRIECHQFLREARTYIEESNLSLVQAGRDFWLTRNRHGAGFWDRNLGETGEFLTALAHRFGEAETYYGDDKKIHIMGAE